MGKYRGDKPDLEYTFYMKHEERSCIEFARDKNLSSSSNRENLFESNKDKSKLSKKKHKI